MEASMALDTRQFDQNVRKIYEAMLSRKVHVKVYALDFSKFILRGIYAQQSSERL